jgi:hypothetical protein
MKNNSLQDTFKIKAKNGEKIYNLLDFYYFDYDVEEIVNMFESFKIPFGMEMIHDSTARKSYRFPNPHLT